MKTTRLLTLFTALILALSTYASDFRSGDLYYNITSNTKPYTVEVTFEYYSSDNYSGLTTVAIPTEVSYEGQTYSVTSIGSQAFFYCSSLTSIIIPESVTSIGVYAFYNCSSLTSITIPSSVTSIGDSAFYDCSSLTSITIPSSVTSIEYGTFYNCISLTSITIPESVTSIGEYAFSGCSGLTSITIPESVTSIGMGAFEYCSGLTSITIPESVMSIGYKAFYKCSSLTSITIPSSVTSIEYGTFYNCISLTSITIPESVTSIEESAFSFCSSLTSITILESVTSIGESAFDGCEQLTQLELPSIKTIAPYAFANCIRLSKAMFGQNLEQIGDSAFANCGKLIRITCYATIVPLGNENSFANYNGYLYVPCDLLPDYSADLLFGKFQNIQCIAAEPSTGTTEVTIVSGATDATFTWPVSDNTQSYTLEISKDGEVFCTLRFNGNGQLLGISFAPSNGTETQNVGAALTALGYQFSVTGLNSASLYTYELKALDASNNELASYAGQFSTDGYVGIGNVEFIEGVYAQNGAIVIDNDTNLPVAIYDVVGRLLASGSSLTQYFEVPNAGVYIVKIGEQTMKVLVP